MNPSWYPRHLLVLAMALTLSLVNLPGSFASPQTKLVLLPRKAYQFTNGQWFDGKGFRRKTFYSVNGIFTEDKPRVVDEVIKLANGFVVPPFADAHCHNFGGTYNSKQMVEKYLRDGIFYVKVLNNSHTGAQQVASLVNNPTSVDVSFAHGGLTANYGHPIEIYERVALGYYTPKQWEENAAQIRESRRAEGNAYYIIDTATDLERKWLSILAARPDFLKVYLLHSEKFDAGRSYGLDPKLIPQIVSKAHAAKLRVSAHVETAADYHTALMAGVDEFAHLPGYYMAENEDARKYEISVDDAKQTAGRGVWVVPTAHLVNNFASKPVLFERVRAAQIRNLKLLKDLGVRFAIGGDGFGHTSTPEAMYLSKLGVFASLELLKIWCEDTPQTIFPERKIGRLRKGYEASFVVLGDNPVGNFEHVKGINMRFKQGQPISLAE